MTGTKRLTSLYLSGSYLKARTKPLDPHQEPVPDPQAVQHPQRPQQSTYIIKNFQFLSPCARSKQAIRNKAWLF